MNEPALRDLIDLSLLESVSSTSAFHDSCKVIDIHLNFVPFPAMDPHHQLFVCTICLTSIMFLMKAVSSHLTSKANGGS